MPCGTRGSRGCRIRTSSEAAIRPHRPASARVVQCQRARHRPLAKWRCATDSSALSASAQHAATREAVWSGSCALSGSRWPAAVSLPLLSSTTPMPPRAGELRTRVVYPMRFTREYSPCHAAVAATDVPCTGATLIDATEHRHEPLRRRTYVGILASIRVCTAATVVHTRRSAARHTPCPRRLPRGRTRAPAAPLRRLRAVTL